MASADAFLGRYCQSTVLSNSIAALQSCVDSLDLGFTMNMMLRLCCLLLVLAGPVQSFAQGGEAKRRSPFSEYPYVAPQVFVYERELFTQYKGVSVVRANVSDFETRSRLGIVAITPKVSAYLDRIDNSVHGPSFFEITDLKTGALIGKFDLGLVPESAELLFTGQSNVYLHHVPTSVCFGSVTRKFVLTGKRLVETQQAIAYLNADADIFGDIKLFSRTEISGAVVATVQEGARVTVLGIAPDSVALNPSRGQSLPTLLIKTPLGLTGWYVPSRSGGEQAGVTITQCN